MLAGRYPSDQFAGLRPRVVWDRAQNRVRGARRRAARGRGERRHDPRPRPVRRVPARRRARRRARRGDGVREPRRRELRARRVDVAHRGDHLRPGGGHAGAGRAGARRRSGSGDKPGRPLELGRALGALGARAPRTRPTKAEAKLARDGLDERAPLEPPRLPRRAGRGHRRGARRPHDRDRALRRRDRRLARLHPHAVRRARARAVGARDRGAARARSTCPCRCSGATTASSAASPSRSTRSRSTCCSSIPRSSTSSWSTRLPSTSLFASRFRENAARALLLPRRRPGERTPLWQQRQRAAGLLEVASGYPTFPILLETTRECLRDVFDLPALREVLTDVRSRRVRVVAVETRRASPFAQSAAVRLDRGVHVRGRRAARRTPRRRARARPRPAARSPRRRGAARAARPGGDRRRSSSSSSASRPNGERATPTTSTICSPTSAPSTPTRSAPAAPTDPAAWLDALLHERRVIPVGAAVRGGRGRGPRCATRSASRSRPACPTAFTDPVPQPARRSRRPLRAHARAVHHRRGASRGSASPPSGRSPRCAGSRPTGRIVHGEFRPGGVEREWCDAGVLRALRRRSLAALRHEVEPVDAATFVRFLPAWHGIARAVGAPTRCVEAIEQLQGVAIPVSVLERDVLPARVDGYRPAMLDELCAAGELVWIGAGRARRRRRPRAPVLPRPGALLVPSVVAARRPSDPLHDAIREQLTARGRVVLARPRRGAPASADEAVLLTALWDLVWAGEVTNDTFGPLRAPRRASTKRVARAPPAARAGSTRSARPPAAGRWSLVAAAARTRADADRDRARARAPTPRTPRRRHPRRRCEPRDIAGGFAGVYPVLRALEEAGRIRRGWFVAGLGAAQFALAGAVDRLRAGAAPAGRRARRVRRARGDRSRAALRRRARWPEHAGGRPTRAAGAHVVLVDGACVAYIERGGRALLTFGTIAAGRRTRRVDRRDRRGAQGGPARPLQIERIDDGPARPSPLAPDSCAPPASPTATRASRCTSSAPAAPAASEVDDGIARQGQGRRRQGGRSGQARDRGRQGEARGPQAPEADQDLLQEIGELVVAQRRNEAPDDAAAQIDAKVAEIAEVEKQIEANNTAGEAAHRRGRQRRGPRDQQPGADPEARSVARELTGVRGPQVAAA